MKAVVKIGSHQYLVQEGRDLIVDRLESPEETVFDQVLLTISDSEVQVGTPFLPDVNIKARKVSDGKGKKIRVFKYKAKSRYRKTTGFRPQFTKFNITSIEKIKTKKSENKS
jgi:large subunit ribosomal protein L21